MKWNEKKERRERRRSRDETIWHEFHQYTERREKVTVTFFLMLIILYVFVILIHVKPVLLPSIRLITTIQWSIKRLRAKAADGNDTTQAAHVAEWAKQQPKQKVTIWGKRKRTSNNNNNNKKINKTKSATATATATATAKQHYQINKIIKQIIKIQIIINYIIYSSITPSSSPPHTKKSYTLTLICICLYLSLRLFFSSLSLLLTRLFRHLLLSPFLFGVNILVHIMKKMTRN